VSADLSIFGLFLQASLVVKFIMLLLLIVSIISWSMIFRRSHFLKQPTKSAVQFEDKFWSGIDLGTLYKESQAKQNELRGSEKIFHSGFKEYIRLHHAHVNKSSDNIMDGVYRAMRISLSREVDQLETNLPFLATAGSISPYIGLFGTVWGIMNAFIGLGAVKQATLSMVAPGIAEALIATAMGLFAAIPAVVAYNRYTTSVTKLEHTYATFMEEFSNILYRQTLNQQSKPQNDK